VSTSSPELLQPEEWPAGLRAALAVLVDLDTTGEVPGSSSILLDAGTDRLLAMLADLDITPTVVVDASQDLTVRLPEGVEVDPAVRLDAQVDLVDAMRACERRLGRQPRGVILEGAGQDGTTGGPDLWVADGTIAPFPLRGSNDTVVIPLNPWWHDVTWLTPTHPSPPSSMLEHWSVSLGSIRTYGELMTLRLSAEIGGQPGHVETIQRFLDECIGAGDVWITSFSGVAELVRSSGNH